MKIFLKKYLWFLLMALAPTMAMAGGTLNPLGGNAWDLYVMGNGDAIFQILTAIKLITSSGGFTTLLLVLSTAGFFFLAVHAGFDPGKNLLKMFGFLLSVGLIVQTTQHLKANVNINDPVNNYNNVVTGVPALVAVPSAVISEIGNWMTKSIETAFSVPTELTMSQGGGYNLGITMMQDAQNFAITNPELKKSLAAFAGDCVIPALARRQMSTADLKTSVDLWGTYGAAASPTVFTRYYEFQAANDPNSAAGTVNRTCSATYNSKALPPVQVTSDLNVAGNSSTEVITLENGMGGTASCQAAYSCITQDLQMHGQDLLNAKATQWSKTGTLIPWEQRMQVALDNAAGGQNQGAAGLTPIGTILQSAMVNETNGMFRQASVQSGDNETLLAASVSQAEAQQKSAWATGSIIFQNMMGYVYSVLQAFTFALVPIVLIALMIPGIGKQIFSSFASLLIWMALWEPMLAIVNFLVSVFAHQTLGASWMANGGGLTLQNRYTVNEQTSNLVTVAQFMGTMVPLFAWGLVKGSMAFTEFISHGIGNSFASSAGATAASGNLSMGNMQMNNVNSNKYDTSSKSTVGNQATNVFSNSGASLNTAELGGSTGSQHGQSLSKVQTHTQSLGQNYGNSETAAHASQAGHSSDARAGVSSRTGTSDSRSSGVGHNQSQSTSSNEGVSKNDSYRHGNDHSTGVDRSHAANVANSKGNTVSMGGGLDAGASGPLGGGGGKGGGGAAVTGAPGAAGAAAVGAAAAGGEGGGGHKSAGKAGADFHASGNSSLSSSNSLTSATSSSERGGSSDSSSTDYGHSHGTSKSFSDGLSHSTDHRVSSDHSGGHDRSASHGTSVSSSDSLSSSSSHGHSYSDAVNRTVTVAKGFDVRDLDSYYAQTDFNDAQAFNMMIADSAAFHSTGSAISATAAETSSGWGSASQGIPSGAGIPASAAGFSMGLNEGLWGSVGGAISAGSAGISSANSGLSAYNKKATGMVRDNMSGFGALGPWNMSSVGSDGNFSSQLSMADKGAMAGEAAGAGGVLLGTAASLMPGSRGASLGAKLLKAK